MKFGHTIDANRPWGMAATLQGPPGTGKTSTVIAMISSLLATPLIQQAVHTSTLPTPLHTPGRSTGSAGSGPPRKVRVLVCAQSNAAIDELIMRLGDPGVIDAHGQYRYLTPQIRWAFSIAAAGGKRAQSRGHLMMKGQKNRNWQAFLFKERLVEGSQIQLLSGQLQNSCVFEKKRLWIEQDSRDGTARENGVSPWQHQNIPHRLCERQGLQGRIQGGFDRRCGKA